MTTEFDHIPLSGWYPGHMLKAGREMQRCLRLVDLVVELLDARLPRSSRNPAFRRLLHGKPVVLVANKADLADPDASRAWGEWFRDQGETVVFLDSRTERDTQQLVSAWHTAALAARRTRGATRPRNRPLRIMIAGIPNVGKSTLVNRLAAARKAAVGPKPGVTRQNQWIPLKGDVEVLDTPGVLWPRIRGKTHELKLALAGSMNDDYVGIELLAEYLWAVLREQPGKAVWSLYGLAACPETADELLEAVGRRRGLLRAGAAVDKERSAAILVKEFREGKLGCLTLEPAAER